MAKSAKKNNKSEKRRPYGWRSKVAEICASKGFQLKPHQIDDIVRGKNTDVTLTKIVFTAIDRVEAQHLRQIKKLSAIKARA